MPLPDSRNETYAPESPVRAQTLNDLQDYLIAAWVGAHGNLPFVVNAIEGRDIGSSGTFNDSPLYWKAGVTTDLLTVPLPLRPGDRLKSLLHVFWSGGSGSKAFDIYKQTSAGVYTLVPTWGDTNDPADLAVVTRAQAGTAYTLAAGERLYLRFITSHVDDRYYQVEGVYDHPP